MLLLGKSIREKADNGWEAATRANYKHHTWLRLPAPCWGLALLQTPAPCWRCHIFLEKLQIFLQHPWVELCPSFAMYQLISRRLASKIVRGESFSLLVVWPQHHQPLLDSSSHIWGFAFFKALPLLFDFVTALVWIKCSFQQIP